MTQSEKQEKLAILWENYFAAPKKDKAPIMQEYNDLAKNYNEIAGSKIMTIITSKTKDVSGTAPKEKIEEAPKETEVIKESAPKEKGKIEQIIDLYLEGKTNAEIVALGFNKSTVARQVSEYKKKANVEATA